MIKKLFKSSSETTKAPLQSLTFISIIMMFAEFLANQYGADIKPIINIIQSIIESGQFKLNDVIKLIYQLTSVLLLLFGTFSRNRKPIKI